MNYDTNILAMRRHEMDAALKLLFCHAKDEVAKNVNNKVLIFVNHIESELNTTKKELLAAQTEIERLHKAGRDTWSELRQQIHQKDAETAAFKKNNEELIQRHNAAIASWDEERERALREADRAKAWREKYEDIEKIFALSENWKMSASSIPATGKPTIGLRSGTGTATASDVRMAAQIIANNDAAKAERDHLRAEVERLKDHAFDKDGTPWKTVCGWWSKKYDTAERQMGENAARAERAEAELNESRYETVKAAQEGLRECIRAERAEAELAKAKAILASIEEDGTEEHNAAVRLRQELAAERARLDWLVVSHWNSMPASRAAIDAAMKEGTK